MLQNIHLRQHWRTWIEEFGAPVYYSTMHWESLHKQLRIIKSNSTNNTNHEKDICLKAMKKQIHHLTVYSNDVKISVLFFILFNYFFIVVNNFIRIHVSLLTI